MFVHFGNHYYGKVDVVPNLCHVATRFFHVNFVPLIPLDSCIIVAGSEKSNNFQGVKTALSFKSILVAWLRAALVVLVGVSLVLGLVLAFEHFDGRRTPVAAVIGVCMLGVGPAVILWLTYRFNRAGYDRAVQLGRELGLEPDLIEQYLTTAKDAEPEPAREPEGWERYR